MPFTRDADEDKKITNIQPLTPTDSDKQLTTTSNDELNFYKTWKYSKQYSSINTEGGQKPPPACGSPTFVWHLGIWHRASADEAEEDTSDLASQQSSTDAYIEERFKRFDIHNKKFFEEICKFSRHLQRLGCISGLEEEKLEFCEPQGLNPPWMNPKSPAYTHPFHACSSTSLSFTLWWHDENEDGESVRNAPVINPEYSALRVRVQMQTHVDHVTISFFIDAAKPYGEPQIYARTDSNGETHEQFGRRRLKIANYLERMREICGHQITHGFIEQDRFPEQFYPSPQRDDFSDDAQYNAALEAHRVEEERAAADLLKISDYFYEGIWEDFAKSFDFSMPERDNSSDDTIKETDSNTLKFGKIFANLHGVVMSMPGVNTQDHADRKKIVAEMRQRHGIPTPAEPLEVEANPGLGRFQVFNKQSGEPNTVMKSFLPFLRRMTPWADYRDFVGCGIFDWRALYIGAPGTTGSFHYRQEVASRWNEIPADNMSPNEQIGRHEEWSAMRYLLLTKGEPHREQIGRIIERINALHTMRLFALKNVHVIKNAGIHLQLIGHELDGALHSWSKKRREIEKQYDEFIKSAWDEAKNKRSFIKTIRKAAEWLDDFLVTGFETILNSNSSPPPKRTTVVPIPVMYVEHQRVNDLSDLIRITERRLIRMNAALDKIGRGGAGRILYLINRSKYYAEELNRLYPTLEIGNVDGWINYGQFVKRGLQPTFERIIQTGDRLVSLRERLQTITEMMQTSALIIESEATTNNTAQLSRIATSLYFLEIPLIFIAWPPIVAILKEPLSDTWALAIGTSLFVVYGVGRFISWRIAQRKSAVKVNEPNEDDPPDDGSNV